jgi:hypothetical protein
VIGRPVPAKEFEVIIMVEVAAEYMAGSDRVPPAEISGEPWSAMTTCFQLERNGALFGVQAVVRPRSP